jgi:hypothetical protein
VFVALLVPGLLGLAHSGVLSGAARTAALVAFGAAIVWVVESVPHLLAAADHHALLTGQPTPLVTGHLIGASIVYPLAGFSIAALALLGGRRLTHPVLNGSARSAPSPSGSRRSPTISWASRRRATFSPARCCSRYGSLQSARPPWSGSGRRCRSR